MAKSSNTLNKTTFIVICWNNKDLLKDCFESIFAQTGSSYGIIMVDNGSSDGSVEYVKERFPAIKVVAAGANLGFAKANNLGIEEALIEQNTKYIALLNTDARLSPEWLEKTVRFASLKPKGAFFQGTTLVFDNKKIIDSTHIYVSHWGQAAQGSWLYPDEHEKGPLKVFGVNAAACLISRNFIEAQPYRNQLFDETLFMYLEDVDLAARSTVMGWDNYLVPGARAYHIGSASSGGETGFSDFGLYMTFRNNLGVILKNFPWRIVFRILLKIPRADYHTIKHLYELDKKESARKVIKGRLVSLARVPIYLTKRFKLRKYRTLDSEYLWHLMRRGY